MICVVYWLWDESCFDPCSDGYVGVTAHLRKRVSDHRSHIGKGAAGLPSSFQVQILFRGTFNECAVIEEALRPTPGIGWNRAGGGARSCLGYKHTETFKKIKSRQLTESGRFKGIPKPPEQIELMRAAALDRYGDPAEHIRTSLDVIKGLEGVDRSGINNSMFGRTQSEKTKQLISERRRGQHAGERNPNFGKPRPDSVKDAIRQKLQKSICKRGHQKEPGKPCRECQRIAEAKYRSNKPL
jgi:hypothetical protein